MHRQMGWLRDEGILERAPRWGGRPQTVLLESEPQDHYHPDCPRIPLAANTVKPLRNGAPSMEALAG